MLVEYSKCTCCKVVSSRLSQIRLKKYAVSVSLVQVVTEGLCVLGTGGN